MLFAHLRRGLLAGAAGGAAYGLFVATVVVSLVELAESFEAGGHEAAVSGTTTVVVSVGGGVLWGLFLGLLVFGAVYYFFEPAIPGEGATRSYLLGAAGFVTVSGAPWLVLPPLPPGVEQGLPTDVRLLLYGGMVVAGALACVTAASLYARLVDRHGRPLALVASGLPFVLLLGASLLAPANPTSGAVPAALLDAFRWTVVFGQGALWLVLAGVHAWTADWEDDVPAGDPEPSTAEVPGTLRSP